MLGRFLIAVLLLVSAPAAAQYSVGENSILPTGQFVWQPELSPVGRIRVRINLRSQMAYVFRAGVLIGASNISSGMPGYDTPTGTWRIGYKAELHRSREYEGAAMPYAQFFVMDRGIALHAGRTPGRPASHGCIRLPVEFARLLFGETTRNDIVEVVDDEPEFALSL